MSRSNRADYSCQRKKLVSEHHGSNAVDHELALADPVHQLNADEYSPGGPARFEVEYRPSHPLDGAIILLDEVLKLLYLDHKDRHAAAGVDCIYGRVVGAAFVHRDFVWSPFTPIALSKKRFAVTMSRLAVSRKSRSCPAYR
jgi:hypothetical protein